MSDPIQKAIDALEKSMAAIKDLGGCCSENCNEDFCNKAYASCIEAISALQQSPVTERGPDFINVEKARLIAEHPHLEDAINRLTKCDHDQLLMFADFLRNGITAPPAQPDGGGE